MTKVNRLTPDRLRHELARFEAARGISSAEFYRLLLDGEIGGSPENDAWAVLCGQAVLAGMLSVPPMPPRPEGSLSEVTVLTMELLRERLAKFEAERGMSSAEFYERFNAGLEGDSMDAMEWASLCDFAVDMGILANPEGAHL